MRKRIYRAVSVNKLDLGKLLERVRGVPVVLGIDVAKRDFKAVVMRRDKALGRDEPVVETLSWRAPTETRRFLEVVLAIAEVAPVEAAMEPTGTYGDPLRGLLTGAGVAVYKVSTKHTHDAAEVYDGVPSQHDAKCAAIVGWLHASGRSSRWVARTDAQRDLEAAVDMMVLHDKQELACVSRLEAKLARHFPELGDILELGSATMLALLAEFGDAATIAANGDAAIALMRKTGGHLLTADKPESVVAAARTTTGERMSAGERTMVQALARETNRQRKEANAARKVVEELSETIEATRRMGPVVGKATAAVLVAEAGDPSSYSSAGAYVKVLGLNLKIRNSGKPADQGQLAITKRGSSRARNYLYMAALRFVMKDACFDAWYQRKVERDGGKHKLKAVIALMRKLAAGLWHVARGSAFNATKLFDTARLGLAA